MNHPCDWEGALANCLEVLSTDPDHLGALEILAQAQWYGGEFEAVIQTTSRLLRLNPLEPGYRYTRGMALLSRGELVRAADDFRRALGQSNSAAFRRQVSESLDMVELWMAEHGVASNVGAKKVVGGFDRPDRGIYPYH